MIWTLSPGVYYTHTCMHTCTCAHKHTHTHMESNAHVYLWGGQGRRVETGEANRPSQHVIIKRVCNTKFPWFRSFVKKAMLVEPLPMGRCQPAQRNLVFMGPSSWLVIYSTLFTSSNAPIWFNYVPLPKGRGHLGFPHL